MIPSDEYLKMAAEVARDTPKSGSQWANRSDEYSEAWDALAAEIARMRKAQPGAMIEIPYEIPEVERA